MEMTEKIALRLEKLIDQQVKMKRLLRGIYNDFEPVDPRGIDEDSYCDKILRFLNDQQERWDQLILETDQIRRSMDDIKIGG